MTFWVQTRLFYCFVSDLAVRWGVEGDGRANPSI